MYAQDVHRQEVEGMRAEQGQQAEAEVQRLTAQLARQQRQTQQVCCAAYHTYVGRRCFKLPTLHTVVGTV